MSKYATFTCHSVTYGGIIQNMFELSSHSTRLSPSKNSKKVWDPIHEFIFFSQLDLRLYPLKDPKTSLQSFLLTSPTPSFMYLYFSPNWIKSLVYGSMGIFLGLYCTWLKHLCYPSLNSPHFMPPTRSYKYLAFLNWHFNISIPARPILRMFCPLTTLQKPIP